MSSTRITLPAWRDPMSDGCSVPKWLRLLVPLETPEQIRVCRRHDEAYYYGGTASDRLREDLTFALGLLDTNMKSYRVVQYYEAVRAAGGPRFKIPGVSWAFGGERFCYGEKAIPSAIVEVSPVTPPGAQERAAAMVEQAVAASFTGLRTQSEVVALMLDFAAAEIEQAVQAVLGDVDEIVGKWEAAYPEDVFRSFKATDHPNVSPDRIAAEMGRHMARELRKQIAALRARPAGATGENG